MKLESIIFDLDGTLIDSSASILSALNASFERVGCKPAQALTKDIIGPPLQETLALVSGSNDQALLTDLAAAFKTFYDTVGYRQTTVFPGVDAVLRQLAAKGLALYIATNKRIKPTQLIVKHLDWCQLFKGIYALDYLTPPATDKTELIAVITSTHRLDPTHTLYVGDQHSDAVAALVNNIQYAHATWGYGTKSLPLTEMTKLAHPSMLLNMVNFY
ncbi:MAG: hypothetical protein COZ09_01130 [Comamonadaceae bacterium CG_4_10_14_3_um_filter_60_42]|nr:MAG: hypothetical protein COZ09_01130 [Comamonadaceae bacterium CG_4_10_14_3_um_filter_60_42]